MKRSLQSAKLDYLSDTERYFLVVREMAKPVWLDSGNSSADCPQRHIIAASPSASVVCYQGMTYWREGEELGAEKLSQPLLLAEKLLGGERPAAEKGGMFCGGWIGYLSYDLARYWMPLEVGDSNIDVPEMVLGRYDWAVVVDDSAGTAELVGFMDEQAFSEIRASFEAALAQQSTISSTQPKAHSLSFVTEKNQYLDALDSVFDYIREGDCYQVNYTQRLDALTDDDAWDIYLAMRANNPAPYGAYMDFGDFQILSSSPEKFLSLKNGVVETKPIKGTRPRYADPAMDAAAMANLSASEKDRAENLMIVDLLRNDLGKVCEPGSISVPTIFDIESFATVHHLVSTVRGRLRKDAGVVELLEACFPGGSITGAPKLRAMEIIDELEPVRRDIYCGSIIRWGFDGSLDSSISIRTLLKKGSDLHYWAGGGIVKDSNAEDEYQESLAKAAAFLDTLKLRLD